MADERMGSTQIDRAAGVLVGAAAGDALGAAYEFGPPCPADAVAMGPGALTGRPAGNWTDDTDMALCVAQVAAQGQRLDEREGLRLVAEQFLRWYADHPPDIGNQTRAVLSATTDSARMAEVAAIYQLRHPDAAGNGSLMRTGPVVLAHLGNDDDLAAAARAVSSLTHPHHLAGDACVLWCIALDRAIRQDRLDGIRDGIALLPADRHCFWEQAIDTAGTAPIAQIGSTGFVVSTLQAAWRAIISTAEPAGSEHLPRALRAAVALGGDTDTVAAVAGQLLGARYGASAVPVAWRRRLGGWPSNLGYDDLVAMGASAVQKGLVTGSR